MLARMAVEKVLIVGSGLTGAVTAALLRQHLPNNTDLQLWDKARGAGGRMSTSRSPQDGRCTVDLGAQYISTSSSYYNKHQSIYSELLSAGLLEPLTGLIEGGRSEEDSKHFITPKGISSLAKHFINKSSTEVKYGKHITEMSEVDKKWQVKCQNGESDMFDCVVLTMPTPQILQLQGSIASLIESQSDIKSELSAVTYSGRFAMGLFFEPGTTIDVPWCAKYYPSDPCIRYIAIDNKKRNLEGGDVGVSVAVHSSVPFGLSHLEEDKDAVCMEHILPRVKQLLPQLPQHTAAKNHKWRYSQVQKGYSGSPGAIVLQQSPLVVCGGDAFTFSKFDGCVDSAIRITEEVTGNHMEANL